MKTNFKVCIHCHTFNHAPYIEDAMNGFTMQQTNFPFIAVIIDDASNDGETEIIKQYFEKNFDLNESSVVHNKETDDYVMSFARHKKNHNCYFAIYLLKYNHYSIKKGKIQYYKDYADSKYIAYCEGDDYWTNAHKLQLQYDYLTSQNTCHFCYFKARRFIQKTNTFKGIWGGNVSSLDQALTAENVIPTFTICYDKEKLKKYQEEISPSSRGWHLGDLPVFLWFAAHGGLHYIDEFAGVYRVLEESASHSKDPKKTEVFLKDVMNIKLLFDEKYNTSNKKEEINDIFSRKFLNLYIYSFKSVSKSYKSYKQIKYKKVKDLIHLLRGCAYIFIEYCKQITSKIIIIK